jgi:predicted nucleic acid-binding protein
MIYALDTNIVIHYLRGAPKVQQDLNNAVIRGDNLAIPKIVDYEIRRGFRIFPAPKKEAVYQVLVNEGFCAVMDMDAFCWERAEHVYADLYRKRLTVGEMDILIAAFCLENNCTLVTNNVKHFEGIEGLTIVDWLR